MLLTHRTRPRAKHSAAAVRTLTPDPSERCLWAEAPGQERITASSAIHQTRVWLPEALASHASTADTPPATPPAAPPAGALIDDRLEGGGEDSSLS